MTIRSYRNAGKLGMALAAVGVALPQIMARLAQAADGIPQFTDTRRLPDAAQQDGRAKEVRPSSEDEKPKPDVDDAKLRAAAAEAQRIADETARRASIEADQRRKAEETAEAQRRAELAAVEARRKADDDAKRLAAEAEQVRLASQAAAARKAEEALAAQTAAAEDAKRRDADLQAKRARAEADAEARQKSEAVARQQEARAAAAVAAAKPAARSPFDGNYTTHLRPACGQPFQTVLVRVTSGTVEFQHIFQGVPYGWRGTVDAAGGIKASVDGGASFSADGRFVDQHIDLHYPQCASEPIVMQIRGRTAQ